MTAAAVRSAVERERLTRLALASDVELGVQLLRAVPTNERRSDEELARHSSRALEYGTRLAAGCDDADTTEVEVVEVPGGLRDRVLATYDTRRARVELHAATITFCEALVDELGWRNRYPHGTVRRAAIAHERAHHLVTADRSVGLRAALDHTVFRLGRWRRLAYIAGTDELAAHAFSTHITGARSSMLLLTAAATAALALRDDAPGSTTTEI